MKTIEDRIQAAKKAGPDRYQKDEKGEWITIGGRPGKDGKHVGGTHVEVDESGNIKKGPDAIEGQNVNRIQAAKKAHADSGKSPAMNREQKTSLPPKNEGETEKQWLKRIISTMPAVNNLPETHDSYFNMDKSHATIPMDQLRSTKSDEENQQGGGNAPKLMDLSRQGLIGKRDPITVRKNDQGGYDVVDGNGTFTGAKASGWKNMPVQIEGHGDSSQTQPANVPPFFNDAEMSIDKNGQGQPISPNAGYKALAEKGEVANHDLRVFLDFGKGIGSQLGYETVLPGTMNDQQILERASRPGGFVLLAPVKGEKRAAEKVNSDYQGDWSKLLDISRATIAVDSIEDVQNVVKKLRESGIKFARRPKDRMANPTEAGYRDIMTNVVMPNGVVAELQINLKPMLVAKSSGHHQYEIMRQISDKCNVEGKRPRTPEEDAEYNRALKESQEIYNKAWQQCLGGSQKKEQYSKRIQDAADYYRKSEFPEGTRWITLKNDYGEATTHVLIDESGKIHIGPKSLTGKNLSDFGHHSPKAKPKQTVAKDRPSQRTQVGPAMISIDDLHVDPERFQYKVSGIDKSTGTNAELKKVKEFNPMLGGQLLVWRDPQDGKSYVVNGHHRAELAKRSPRSNEIGKFNGQMPVYYVDAKDHTEARALGALANIAEGRGTATDAARFMRDRGVGLEDFAKVGVSPSGSVANAALELKKLSPQIFQKLSNGLISEGRAQAIAKHLENHEAQDQLFKWIEKNEKEKNPFSDRKVAEMSRATAAIKPSKSGGGLFGDYFEEFPIEQRADIADHVGRALSGEHKSLRDASSTRRQAILESEGDNRLDVNANRTRAKQAASHSEEFELRANSSGHPIAMALDHLAERLQREPKKRNEILREALGTVRTLLENGNSERGTTGSSGQGINPVQLSQDDRFGTHREQSVQPEVTRFSRIKRAKDSFEYYSKFERKN